jgi:copper resistance protein C
MTLRTRGLEIVAVGLLCLAIPLYGHAILVSATPSVEALVQGPSFPIKLRFNSRVDRKRSSLKLIGPDGAPHALTITPDGPPDVLASAVEGMQNGAYVLEWQVLATDGHITRGEVRFHVK